MESFSSQVREEVILDREMGEGEMGRQGDGETRGWGELLQIVINSLLLTPNS